MTSDEKKSGSVPRRKCGQPQQRDGDQGYETDEF